MGGLEGEGLVGGMERLWEIVVDLGDVGGSCGGVLLVLGRHVPVGLQICVRWAGTTPWLAIRVRGVGTTLGSFHSHGRCDPAC